MSGKRALFLLGAFIALAITGLAAPIVWVICNSDNCQPEPTTHATEREQALRGTL